MKPKEILQSEGFVHIYEWKDLPNTVYEKHSHKDKVTLFIVAGDVTFTFSDGTMKSVYENERFDVPVLKEHSAVVGINGCSYVVGEMIEGDS
jgi:mannose-6-phosphate isomerase-like protein (cupin superfamily)